MAPAVFWNSTLLGSGKPSMLISMLWARCSSVARSVQALLLRAAVARSRRSSQRNASSSDWTLGVSAMAVPESKAV